MNISQPIVGRTLAVVGAALQIGLAIALLRLAPSLANFFHSLALGGIGDPSALGGAFEEFVEYCAVELIVSLIGLVMLGVALAVNRYRARWFFRFLVAYGVLLLPVPPVGTAFGLFFLIYSLAHRREFPG